MQDAYTITVLETSVSVSGRELLLAAKCESRIPEAGCVLSSEDGKQWVVIRILREKFFEKWRKENIFLYKIEGIGIDYTERPVRDQILNVTENT